MPQHPDILLIEDNEADQRLALESLKQSAWTGQVHAVLDGEQALAFLRNQRPRPGLIILDLNLPRKDGREVLSEIKSDPALRRIPVVVVTTSEAKDDIWRSYDLGANCYLTKPDDLHRYFDMFKAIKDFWFSWAKLPGGGGGAP